MTEKSTSFCEVATNLWIGFEPETKRFLIGLTNQTLMLLHKDEKTDAVIEKRVGDVEEYAIIQARKAQFIDVVGRKKPSYGRGLPLYRFKIADQDVFEFLIDRVREDNHPES